MAGRIDELRQVLELMKEFGVTRYRGVNLELEIPEEQGEIQSANLGEIVNYNKDSTDATGPYPGAVFGDGKAPSFTKPE